MKASILREAKKFDIIDVTLSGLKPNEVLVKVDCVGICGTDVSVYRGDYAAKENVVLGHEYNGTVADIGDEVSKVKAGDYVVSQASWGCNKCHWCYKSMPSYCEAPNMLGRTIDGSLAEYIIVPENILLKISRNVSSIEAQSVVGTATALRALHRSEVKLGDSVLLIGPGYSGLTMLQLCKLAGARDVVMVATRDSRLELAQELGVDYTANIKQDQDWEKKLLKRTENIGFDVCIEASGTVSGLLSCVRLVKKGGRIVQFGTSFNKIDGLPQKEFYSKEISIVGTKGGYEFYPKAVSLLEQKKLKIEPMITHKFPLSEVSRAFEIMDQRLENVLRAVVFCNEY
ncbi:MAG TPA: alcohol dehydrogenase catalytic domain-containing protein [Clostridia bacterium]|nr:alcohol dehydrogenase catalytic domain-containing protein [Clostridia bacterium]